MVKDLGAIAIETVPTQVLVGDGFRLAAQLHHSVYDCLYLGLAMRLEIRLLTADKSLLAKAASDHELARWVQPLEPT